MNRLSEGVKFDIGLKPQTLNNTNVSGKAFLANVWGRICAVLYATAMVATKVIKLELLQCTDAAGTGAKGIPSTADHDATAQATANTLVGEATLTLSTVLAGDTVTINGIVFTAHATVTTYADREFSISGDDTADAVTLAACINHATYGVPGVTATPAVAVITLTSTVPGVTAITASAVGGTVTIATTLVSIYVDLDVAWLDHANGFDYVLAKVTTDANTVICVAMNCYGGRFFASQAVGASAILPA